MEEWKDIEWYEWVYQVSNLGRVKSLFFKNHKYKIQREKMRKLHNDKDWYQILLLSKNKINCNKKVHRLVAQAFLPNPDNKPCINHKNWIRNDNHIENLEWCTIKYNNYYSFIELWRQWKKWENCKLSKKIVQYDKKWSKIKIWQWIRSAWRELWIKPPNISACLKWIWKTAWGFIWKYESSL